MIAWYAAGAILAVWLVFQSTGLDFRLVATGGVAPLFDAFVGHQAVMHSLLGPTVALLVVMTVTAGRGRRLLRRRLIGLPIGWYFGIALGGSFAHREVFWYPAFGREFGDAAVWPPLGLAVALEVAGIVALRTIWSRAGLREPRHRAEFIRSGRLDLP